ncbi:MAG: ECF-type sigma factor [Kofleriaceae bacterium]|nr:ECF-type sigma factor [Kofleriaceae bacterium]
MNELSAVLQQLAGGDRAAANELLPLVYRELRRLAEVRLRKLPPGQTLQPTALVHEAFLELVGNGDPRWNGRGHFFGAAAQAMHDILVDQARRKAAKKRGGDQVREELDEGALGASIGVDVVDVLAVTAALEQLRLEHPRAAEVAMLKVFGDAEDADIAALHEITTRTVERDWRFARAYLARELAR